ncbi:LysM peptidoglycan-binding domain-containing protein [Paucihalobacter sp.]|uniref:LysM peptidoglycan-binding domain-containing protein n=1 Tax=Paucihalobacter sp. TaxID=2850405 RepID=UPI002FE1C999
MKNIITVILLTFTLCINAQDFKTHKVQKGETVESIAKQYFVTPFDILALNPDAKSGFSYDMVLIIPNSNVKNLSDLNDKQLVGFESHKVKRKETLYSISNKYAVTIEDIKKQNTFLYSQNLKRGDNLKIPKFKTIKTQETLKNSLQKYVVQPKDGKWGIAYKYGITIPELEALNPRMNEILQPGEELVVPNIADNEVKTIEDEQYNYYEVLPAEGFYRLEIKLGLKQAELEALNPNLKEFGLQPGMILKVPNDIKNSFDLGEMRVETTNLSKKINNLSKKSIAVMLPFRLHRIDLDSVAEAKDLMRSDKLLSMSLDFHSGLLMALDSAKQLGISTHLKVFDTRSQISEVTKILQENDFSLYDAIIGPITPSSFDRVANTLKSQKVPIIAPLTHPTKLYDNVFQTLPDKDRMKQALINYMKTEENIARVVIISDSKNRSLSDELKGSFPAARQMYSRKNKDGKDGNYLHLADFNDVFRPGKNIVFLETDSDAFVANILSLLNGLQTEKTQIQLATTNVTKAFEGESASSLHLSNLNFHYASFNVPINEATSNGFVKKYKETYGVLPNKYAVRGFDITLDVLLRLASSDNLYEASNEVMETAYLENKFKYNKKLFGGYYNDAVYIVKYDNLNIVEAKQ